MRWPLADELPSDRLAVQLAQPDRRREVVERSGVHGSVLPHIEAVPVEAVRSYLCQQGLDQGAPCVRCPHGIQAVGNQPQIALQLGGRAVPRGIGLDPRPHEADFQAEGLVGVAAPILLPHPRQILAVLFQGGP